VASRAELELKAERNMSHNKEQRAIAEQTIEQSRRKTVSKKAESRAEFGGKNRAHEVMR
jgi:hypothetical protein